MTYLLDTCAVSELRKPRPNAGLTHFLTQAHGDTLYLSAVTVGELTKGVESLPDGRRKNELDAWLKRLMHDYKDRVLPIDGETAQLWGCLTARAQGGGIIIPALDGLIAASALRHDLTVITRNVSDFRSTGAKVENPWR